MDLAPPSPWDLRVDVAGLELAENTRAEDEVSSALQDGRDQEGEEARIVALVCVEEGDDVRVALSHVDAGIARDEPIESNDVA